MKKCAIYIRVSTSEQAQEGFSIQAQKDRLINYCKAREWDLCDVFIDPGYSGSNLNRPEIQRLIREIKNFDVVLVYKIDRLSRSQKDTLFLIEDVFLKNKIDFVSLSESFDTSSSFGRASIGILSVFAQLERETIRERSMIGKCERAKQGLYHGSLVPIGYNYENGKLVINDYEALQVKEIYGLYLQGYGTRKISAIMDDKGYKHKYGGWLHNSTVTNILDNPLYAGKIFHKGELFQGEHEPVISQEIFDNVQEMREKRRISKTKVFQPNCLLSGFVFCSHCGGRYHIRHATNKYGSFYKYYICYSKSKTTRHMVKDINCKSKLWNKDKIEKIVTDKIMKLSIDPSCILNMKKHNQEEDKKEDIKIMKKKIGDIEKQINKLLDLYQGYTLPVKEISDRINALHNEKKSLTDLIEGYEKKENKEINKELLGFISNIPAIWHNSTLHEKRMIIEYLIEKIIISDNKITIIWKFL